MTHPYRAYIEKKAEEYYLNQAHESFCEILNPPGVPTNKVTGETYDVYIIPHCDCWLADYLHNLTTERKFEALRNLSYRFNLHSMACERHLKTAIVYRNKPEIMSGWCNCWLSVDTPKEEEYTEDMTPENPIPTPEPDPNLVRIKAKVDKVRQNALGPHLDTPIYDQLAREYDEKFNTTSYFDTALAKKLEQLGKRYL